MIDMNDMISNRATSWFIINVKARTNQVPSHYVETFDLLVNKDPLVQLARFSNRFISIKSSSRSNLFTNDGIPKWIVLNLIAYTVIDPHSFYDKKRMCDVEMAWNEDVVANKKEAELIFIPEIHKIAVKRSSHIGLNQIIQYLKDALSQVAPLEFDVDSVKDKDTLDRILNADKLLSLRAHISFSNPGHGKMFKHLLDDKIKEVNPESLDVNIQGSEQRPLNKNSDGLVSAIVEMSEENGDVEAVILNDSKLGKEHINTKNYPMVLKIKQIINGKCQTLYNVMMAHFKFNKKHE